MSWVRRSSYCRSDYGGRGGSAARRHTLLMTASVLFLLLLLLPPLLPPSKASGCLDAPTLFSCFVAEARVTKFSLSGG